MGEVLRGAKMACRTREKKVVVMADSTEDVGGCAKAHSLHK